jgi:hypothetical protein
MAELGPEIAFIASEATQSRSGVATVWIASSLTLLAMTAKASPSLRAERSNPETAVRLSGLLRRLRSSQ